MISSMWLNTTGSLVDWECVASSSARITGLCGTITIHTAGITFAAHCLLGAQWIRIFICFEWFGAMAAELMCCLLDVCSATVQPFSRASGSQILAESFWVIGGGMPRHGFPNKEDDTSQRSPAWKPYLYKGKSKLTLCHGRYFSVMLLQISWTSAGLTPKRSFITGISPNWFKISWNGLAWFEFLNDYWWRYHLKNERVRYATMHSYLICASK